MPPSLGAYRTIFPLYMEGPIYLEGLCCIVCRGILHMEGLSLIPLSATRMRTCASYLYM